MFNTEAHEPGPTCLAFSTDGRFLYTGGAGGLARCWDTTKGEQEPEPVSDLDGDARLSALAASSTSWFTGSDDGYVRRYDKGDTDFREYIIKINGGIEVNGLAVDPKGKRIAVAAGDNEVKIIDLGNLLSVKSLKGHTRGVRSVSWCTKKPLLASCGADGKIMIWNLDKPEGGQLIKTLDGVLPVISGPESNGYLSDCTAVWHPLGDSFMVVSRTGEVFTYCSELWVRLTARFLKNDALGSVTAIALCPNAFYVAVAYVDRVVVYNTISSTQIVEYMLNSGVTVTQIAFSPTKNLLAWADSAGHVTRVPEPIPKGRPAPVDQPAAARAKKHAASDNPDLRKLLDDDLPVNGDEASDSGEPQDFPMVDEDDKDEALEARLDNAEYEDRDQHFAREMVSVTKAQPAFQPGATPSSNKKCYLAHNTIGVIEVTEGDTHNIVNVEFYDKSTRRGYSFQDTDRYSLAALGERGAIFASAPIPNAITQPRITYKPYTTWASAMEWSISVAPGEKVVAVAAGGVPPRKSLRFASDPDAEGNGCAIVATSSGFVRFFSGAGLQRYVWAIGGTVVSMVAGSEWVFVVHREAGTSLDGCQNLRYSLMALETFELVQTGPLPLPRRRTLKWIGITDEGAPAMYDSEGILSILDRFRRPTQARWVPVLDTMKLERRKGKDESYWPVGLSSTTFMCLILKGMQEYPEFPRPLVQELNVHMPLWPTADPENPSSDPKDDILEEKFLREQLHVMILADSLGDELVTDEISRREIALDKELIQLIQSACKQTKLQRALDLASLLHHPISFDTAIKVAGFYKLLGLQERLTALKEESVTRDRYRENRSERKNWYQHAAPIPRPSALEYSSVDARAVAAASTSFSQSVGQPARRALAPAVPLNQANPFSKERPVTNGLQRRAQPALSTQETSQSTDFGDESFDMDRFDSPPPPEKRKRVEESMPPPDITERQAKRRVIDEPTSKSANPFARKNPAPKSSALAKSGSFFNKVETATASLSGITSKPKGKAKESTKQTTLFGLPAVPPPKKIKTKGKAKEDDADSQDIDSQETTAVETQRSEVTVTGDVLDAQEGTQGETQEETQEAAPLDEQDNGQDAEGIALKWSPSPPPSTARLGNDIMVQN